MTAHGLPKLLTGSLLLCCLSACSIGATYWPSDEELEAFEKAGPITPELDVDQLDVGLPQPGPYRLVPGDILSVNGGDVFERGSPTEPRGPSGVPALLEARVMDDGTTILPMIGTVEAAGGTLMEVEARITEALYPDFVREPPTIVARVAEFATRKVAVLGAVERPGTVHLPSDQLSLIGALTAAGGILKAGNLKVGAKWIRIRRPDEEEPETRVLPVRGLNIPFGDLALSGGEIIEVERWDPDIFTVVGLVKGPGAYEYPPNRTYNLMEAIAIAGGTDLIADPPYATVFRKDALGNVVAVTFGIHGDDRVRASSVEIRPGDVVSLQHTIGSWTRSVLSDVFRAQVNFFVDPLNNN